MTDLPVLVGQYDSPFVRRVAVALHHHGIRFERRVLSVYADFDALLELSPLGKVPVLVLPGGAVLPDSHAIIEYLEVLARTDRRLTPANPADRLAMLRIEAVAIGLAEKAVALNTERRYRAQTDPEWQARLARQIGVGLSWLDAAAAGRPGPRLDRADLALATALTYLRQKLPELTPAGRNPALEAACDRAEALPAFAAAPFGP